MGEEDTKKAISPIQNKTSAEKKESAESENKTIEEKNETKTVNRTNSVSEDPLDRLDYDVSDDENEEKRGFKNERKNSVENNQNNG